MITLNLKMRFKVSYYIYIRIKNNKIYVHIYYYSEKFYFHIIILFFKKKLLYHVIRQLFLSD